MSVDDWDPETLRQHLKHTARRKKLTPAKIALKVGCSNSRVWCALNRAGNLRNRSRIMENIIQFVLEGKPPVVILQPRAFPARVAPPVWAEEARALRLALVNSGLPTDEVVNVAGVTGSDFCRALNAGSAAIGDPNCYNRLKEVLS